MERPEFDSIKDFEEFSKYYWYRDELIKICKGHGLKAPSGKIQLYDVIEAYFNGTCIPPEKKEGHIKKAGKKDIPLSLETGLIECGFTFGPKFRKFFEEQTGTVPFKFNVDMVATVKKVKDTNDMFFTLGDLFDVYYEKKTYAKYDKSALQWNKFVQDFCADETNSVYSEKLKIASKLWKIVKESDMEKIYSHDLLEKYKDLLEI